MFGSKKDKIYSIDTFPVPYEWIFEKLLNLSDKLIGQSVSIKSIFNPKDTNPSMIIYFSSKINKYKFKDFSSGRSGDAIDLVQIIFNLPTRQDAFGKAEEIYSQDEYAYLDNRSVQKINKSITNYTIRKWSIYDQQYWTQYNIGSKELEYYGVRPLSSYTLTIKQGEESNEQHFQNALSYGFFRKTGELYKIYNPKNTVGKFIKVKNYIQGHDQLKYKGDWLIIVSSLKDLIAFRLLKLPNIECIAPDSENTMLTKKQINFYKKRYKLITVLFDNDVAGLKAAKKYNKLYGLHYTQVDVEKDIAECVKQHGIKNTKMWYVPALLKTKDEARRKSN
jgi:hypothetical protein